ncbi:BRCT domain-containing protein [Providencia rettgeri]|uniref:BRCT domain-containing protein n=3 Tax=Providencia TaxID=586 RepID=A0ABY9ZDT3_9GAMM|nr:MULTISPECIES: BRCT domain-containing protein [Providencia]ELT5686668.1 BRCT domain-containing protein [Providencia rettgeri]EMC8778337.1 BRCT domain-containing protein [Providencia rettgeri]MBQ0533432.1 BRCT domain-containing protein [Providencia huaxiensis]MBQ0586989.1 BRCT domain-containing protein [Providencia huaxiensis]MBW3104645.1 BRCT domain-containing protein [Providencia rettgeri]
MNINPAFNYKRNRDKLFANLISIIDGVLSDCELSDSEILYITTWLSDSEVISSNPFVMLLQERISRVLEDGVITAEERQEIKQTLLDVQRAIMDMPNVDLYSKESDINLLNGLCKGIVADKDLSIDEINYLDWWLTQNGMLKRNYPGKHLYQLVKTIKEDGVIDQNESDLLYKALVDFSGTDLNTGIVDGLSCQLPCDDIDSLDLYGASFCLTGNFVLGKRSIVSKMIEDAGGSVTDRVTQSTDYLVIGGLSSRDWRYSTHGRKIEKAIDDRDSGKSSVKITTEDILMKYLPAS